MLLPSQKLHRSYEVVRPMRDEMIGCCGNYIFGESMSFEIDHDLDSSPYPHSEAHMSNSFAKVYTSPEIQEKLQSSAQSVILLKRRQISPLLPIEGIMTPLESVKNHSSPTRLPPSAKEPLRVSEAEYWKTYYEYPDGSYEWKNGLLEAKPMPDFLSISLYRWFSRLLEEYLTVFPIGRMMVLEMGFRLELGDNEVSIRKPDLAVILHSNPVEAKPLDRSFHGVCDLCIEFLSDSTPEEVERDTVHKKREYAKAGVAEYYILDRLHRHTAFYFLNQQGVYEKMKHQEPGVIHSRVLDRFAFRLEDLEKQVAFETLIEDPLYQPFLLKSFQQERQLKESALAREEKERQQKERALAREEKALAEVERLRALLQEKNSDPR